MKRNPFARTSGSVAYLFVASLLAFEAREALATDERDGEVTTADPIADLVGLYAWTTDRDTIVAVITFGLHEPGQSPTYDANVLYTLHIDNTADPRERGTLDDPLVNTNDNASDLQVHVRFGQNSAGDWGFQVLGLPGARSEALTRLVGPGFVDGGRGTRAQVGVFDNPEFFDAEGYGQTLVNLSTDDPELAAPEADLAFASIVSGTPRDSYAGTNVHAIILEFDTATAVANNGDDFLQLWATTSRIADTPGDTDGPSEGNDTEGGVTDAP